MTPRLVSRRRPVPAVVLPVRRGPRWCRLGVERLEERLAPAGLPPDLVVGRTLSAYSVADVADRTLTVTYTVYNQRGYDVSGVLLTTTLQPGVAFSTATAPTDRSGQELAWSLGTLPANGRASVAVTVTLPDPLPLVIDDGATAFGTLNTAAVTADTPAATLTTRVLPPSLLASTPDANTADPFVQEQAARLRYDPQAIFDYLNTEVGYESYAGSLRGSRGTLWSAAGNSLDEASLGVALFRASGIPARYAHGTLPDNLSKSLILSMFPASYQTVGFIPPGTEVADPANDPKLLAETRDHYWLQIDTGAGFQNADSSGLPGGGVGTAFTTTTETFGEVPDALRHKVRVSLDAEIYNQATALFGFSDGRSTRTVLDQTFNSVDLVGRPLTLGHTVNRSSAGFLFVATTTTYEPYLIVGDVARPEIGSDQLIPGQLYQEVATNFPLGTQVLTGVFLHVALSGPQQTTETFDRALVDRIGYDARSGFSRGSVTSDPDAPPPLSDLDAFTLDVAVGRNDPKYPGQYSEALRQVGDKLTLLNNSGSTAPYVPGPVFFEVVATITRAIAGSFRTTSDVATARLAADARVTAYTDRPRVVLVSSRLTPNAGGETVRQSFTIDLLADTIRGLAAPGQAAAAARGFQVLYGVSQTYREQTALAAFIPPDPGLTRGVGDYAVVQAAVDQGVPLAVLTASNLTTLDSMPLSAVAKARITAAVGRGQTVIVPIRPVQMGDAQATAWYEVDPLTGRTVGTTEDGGHNIVLYVQSEGLVLYKAIVFQIGVVGFYVLGAQVFLAILYTYVALLIHSLPPYLEGVQTSLDPEGTGSAAGLPATSSPLVDRLKSAIGSPLPGAPATTSLLDPIPDPAFPLNGATADIPVAAELTAGPAVAAVQTPGVRLTGRLSTSWAASGDQAFRVSGLSAAATTVRAADGTVVGTGAIELADAAGLPLTATGGVSYGVTGTGTLAAYFPAAGGLGAAADWTAYTATLSGEATLRFTTAGLRLNGALLPAGTYTVTTSAATLTGGGPGSAPRLSGPVTVQATDTLIQLGSGTGTASVGGTALNPAGGVSLTGFSGTVAITSGATAVGVTVTGTAAGAVSLAAPAAVSADQNQPATFQLGVRTTRADTYHTDIDAPPGWTVTVDAAGRVTIAPPPGTQAGSYPVVLRSSVLATPDFAARTVVTVTVTPTAPGVTLAVPADPLFPVAFNGAPVPTGFRVVLGNLGPAAAGFDLSVSGIPAGFAAVLSQPALTVPAGRTGVVGLYLQPVAGTTLPAPGTVLTFTVTATSTTDPTLTRSQTVTFTMPEVHAVTATVSPGRIGTTPGETVAATLTLTAVGNVPEVVSLAAVVEAGLTVGGLPPTVTLAVGQSVTVPLTLTVAGNVPLNSDLTATLTTTAGPVVQRVPVTVRVAVPGADAIATASAAAAELGNAALADRLRDLSTALTNLVQSPGDPVFRSQALAALGAVQNLAAADPYLATTLQALTAGRDQLTAATTEAQVRTATVALGAALGDFGDTLAAEARHRFDLSLAANTAVAQPLVAVPFNVLLRNTGTVTTTYDLTVEGLPAGVTAVFSQTEVTLAPGETTFSVGTPNLTLILTPGAGEIAAVGFEVRATARPAAAITRATSGSLTARRELVTVVAVTPTPAFTDPGGQVAVSVRVLNAVNREQTATVRYTVTDAGGTVRFTSPPIATTLGVLTSLSTVDLGNLDTTGFAVGDYTLTVTVSDAAGQPIPGATGVGRLLVGSPVSASLSVGPETLPTGTSTVTNSLVIDVTGQQVGPLGVVSLTDLPGAGGVVKNGHYVYASGTTGIGVFDIADPANPQLIRTFGSSATKLEIRGDKLYALSFGGPFGRFPLSIYSLADPETPQLLGTAKYDNADGIPYSLAWNMVVTDTHVFVSLWSTTQLLGNPQDIKYQIGDVIAIDVSDPAAPVFVSAMLNTYGTNSDGIERFLNVDVSGGDGNLWEIVQVDANTLLVAGSTARGDNTQIGSGVVHVIDISDPTHMAIVRTLTIPGTVQAVGLAIEGNRAFVTASQGGWKDPAPANEGDFTGNLVLATLDISDPRNPVLIHSDVQNRSSFGPYSLHTVSLGNGLFAFSSQGNGQEQSALVVVDASNPTNLVTGQTTIPAINAFGGLDGAGNFLYSTSPSGLIIYQVDAPDAIPATARVTVPTADGVSVVPGSFSLAPSRTIPAAGGTTYEWDLSLGATRTITWQSTVSNVQPGRSRLVATAGQVSFVSQGTPGTLALADQTVTGAQVIGLTPATRTVAPAAPAGYTVRLFNPTAAAVTYTLTVPGIPAGWVSLPATVVVPAGGTADVPLSLTSDSFAALDEYGFMVAVSGSNGAASAVTGGLVLQGVPAPVDAAARGVVVALSPVQARAGQGATAGFVVRVTNTGSETATFALGLAGLPSGVAAAFDRPTLTVPPGAGNFREVVLTLTPAVGTPVGAVPFTVSATDGPTAGTAVGTLTVTAGGVSVALDRPTAAPGDAFQLTVTNTGTAADTFALSVAGPSGLVATLGVTQVTLAPGESRAVTLATGGVDFAVAGNLPLMVAATSTADPAVRSSATAGLSVPPSAGLAVGFEPAAVTLPAPSSSDFLFRVSNTGNQEAEYTLTIAGTSGPVTAFLVGLDGLPTQAITSFRLPGLATGVVLIRTTLTVAGQGLVTVNVRSLTDGRTASSTATVQTPPVVVPPVVPPVLPPTVPPRPQPALVGGRADGAATVLVPTGDTYALGPAVVFFPGFAGDARVATGDVTGDGVADFVGGAGPGGGPRVAVIDGATGRRLADFYAFEDTFTGGVFVAVGDLDGDGLADVIVTPDLGGGPVVAAFSGARLTAGQAAAAAQLARFFGIEDREFRGGARAAAGDVDGDGRADVLVSAGFPGGPRIALFRGSDVAAGSAAPGRLVPDFFAFEETFRNGSYVAAGDVDGDGVADLVFGGGPGGGPRVRVVSGRALLSVAGLRTLDDAVAATPGLQLANFFAGDPDRRGGVRVTVRDVDGDGRAELVAGSGDAEPGQVRVYRAATAIAGGAADHVLDPFPGADLAHGTFVG